MINNQEDFEEREESSLSMIRYVICSSISSFVCTSIHNIVIDMCVSACI